METFCLILLGKGLETETTNKEYCHGLHEGFKMVLDQLLRSDRRNNNSSSIKDDYLNTDQDPIITLLQSKRELNVALICSRLIEDSLQSLDIVNSSHWLSVSKNKAQLIGVLESLKASPQHGLSTTSNDRDNENHSSINECHDEGEREDDDDDNSTADQIHQLADLLPSKGDALVQVYWILPEYKNLNLSNTLPMFGAMKRLQECNNSHITIVSSTTTPGNGFMNTWKKWLKFSTVYQQNTPSFHEIPIWHGSLTYVEHKKKSLISLPGFALTLHDKGEKESYLQQSEDSENSHSRPSCDVVLLPEIQVLNFTPRNSIPLFLFLPFKLKLDLLCDDEPASKTLLEKLKCSFSKGLCMLACIALRSKSSEETNSKINLESWMDHVSTSLTLEQPRDCLPDPTNSISSVSRRLCVIDTDVEGSVCVYLFHHVDALNGKFYEYLENLTKGKKIVQNAENGNHLYLEDLSDSLLDIQKEIAALHCQDIKDEIENHRDNGFEPITDEDLYEITMFSAVKHFPHQSLHPGQQIHIIDLTSASSIDHSRRSSDMSVSPRMWSERLWLMQNDPAELSARQAKHKAPVGAIEQVLAMSAKDILKRFRSDGRPVKGHLSPLRPAVKKNFSENHIHINTNEDTIQETCYPESLMMKYHGVEYCLDSCSSLSKDAQLSSMQSSVIRQETLSLCSEQTPRAFPKKTKSTTTQSVAKHKTSVNSATEPIQHRQTRSTKRHSPPTNQTSKQVKRKRNESPKNEVLSNESTKTKETRSQRHKRRLRLVVDKTLDENGINTNHTLYSSCSERLYTLIKSFLKDLKSSHGLNETMKELARSNVEQVVHFEKSRQRAQEKTRTKSRDKPAIT